MRQRDSLWSRMQGGMFDVAIVGAGINGAVCAAALSARGARVLLLDRGDIGGGTSMQSSNLVWGGIKYLESLELGLVRSLCRSRNTLLSAYPTAVREVRFLATHARGFRHSLLKLWAGSWLYWLLGGGFTRRPRLLPATRLAAEEPVLDPAGLSGGFEYSDAWLPDNDARFTFGFVRDALRSGAVVLNYSEARSLQRRPDGTWSLQLRDVDGGREADCGARFLVNAAGPWADALNSGSGLATRHHHVFSRGIHLIVDRVTDHERVLAFFADDGRPFFVIPMEGRSCLGTTDTRVGAPETQVTAEDRRFVLDNVNRRLRLARPLTEREIIAERCGVRPLVVAPGGRDEARDWTHLSRRHVVESRADERRLTIFGGKLTDCLNVGEEVCALLERMGCALPHRHAAWFGEPSAQAREAFEREALAVGLTATASQWLWRRYGRDAAGLLRAIHDDPSLALPVVSGGSLLRCEVRHAAAHELVVRMEDLLRRRTSLSLVMRRETLVGSAGLRQACGELFGDEAERRWDEWLETTAPSRDT